MKRLYGGLDIRRYLHHMIDLDEKEQILYHFVTLQDKVEFIQLLNVKAGYYGYT